MKLSSMTIQITSRHLKIHTHNSQVLCNRDVIIIITVAMCKTSCEIDCNDVQQEVKVRTVTPVRKKRCFGLPGVAIMHVARVTVIFIVQSN